jgi:AraC-like DNA-binding protein
MPLAMYLFEKKNKGENKLFPSSPAFTRREMSVEDLMEVSDLCYNSGISLSTLTEHESRLFYRSTTCALLESASYSSLYTAGLTLHGNLAFDGYGMSIQHKGFARWHMDKHVVEIESGGGSILDLQHLKCVEISARSQSEGLFLTNEYLTRELSNLIDSPILNRLKFSPKIGVNSPEICAIRSIMEIISRGLANKAPLRKAPLALTNLNQAIIYLILQKIPHNYSYILDQPQLPLSPRHIKRAIEFIHANLDKPITVKEIAEGASVSIRTLQTGFRKFREMSPMTYLKMQRLAAVKKDILDHKIHDSIEEIALRWGFSHFYLFKKNYQEAFGETPRDTLEKRK